MKKILGSVSLFTAMIFLMVVSVFTATITSAKIHGAKVMVGTALSLSMDSLFAAYDSELFDRFGVLFFDGTGGGTEVDTGVIAGKILKYMESNIDTGNGLYFVDNTDLLGISADEINISRYTTATDYGGLLWMDEVVDYEKYAKAINLAAEYLELIDGDSKTNKIKEVSDDMIDCADAIIKLNDRAIEIIKYVDGVDLTDADEWADAVSGDKFLKSIIVTDEQMKNIDIGVFVHELGEFIYPLQVLERVKNGECGLDELTKLITQLSGIIAKIDELEFKLGWTDLLCEGIDYSIVNLQTNVGSLSDLLDENTITEMTNDLEKMKGYKEVLAENICDLQGIKITTEYNKAILVSVVDKLQQVYEGETGMHLELIDDAMELLSQYTHEGLEINYGFLGKGKSNTSFLDRLSDFMDKGILSLVVPEGESVSVRYMPYKDLASSVVYTEGTSIYMSECGSVNRNAKKIVYGEYVMDNFSSFVDKKEGAAFDYEVEYILYGKPYDAGNLKACVDSISAVRTGANMIYLITDSEKKEQAYTLAMTMVGWSGYEVLAKIVQYALLFGWAYAESLVDARTLLNGDRVAISKTDESWQLTFEKLLTFDLSHDKDKANRGMDYESFLRLFLFLQDESEKAAYTMDLVELYMIANGRENFRLKNYVFSVEAEINYSLKGIDAVQSYKAVETY